MGRTAAGAVNVGGRYENENGSGDTWPPTVRGTLWLTPVPGGARISSEDGATEPAITFPSVSPTLVLTGLPKFFPCSVIVNPPLVGPKAGVIESIAGLSYENICVVEASKRPSLM